MSIVDTHYRRIPGESRAKHERRAMIQRAALKAAMLPAPRPVAKPVVRRKVRPR